MIVRPLKVRDDATDRFSLTDGHDMSHQPLTLDLHVDSIIQQRLFRYDMRKRHGAGMRGQPLFWHADVPRMSEARYVGACLGIHFWPWESERGWREANKQIDYLDDVVAADSSVHRVFEVEDWEEARRVDKLALAPGVEGAHMLNGRVERVAELAARGVAYLTLTHFCDNFAATPSMGRGADETTRLTDGGRELIAALEEHDVLVDLAHTNTPCVLDACDVATRPLFCTHTGVKGAFDHARNITDDEIDAIAELDGVIGIMFAPGFLAGDLKADSTVVAEHIHYVAERVGIRHVAIGSDYDGWLPRICSDMRDCRDISTLYDNLAVLGFDEDDLDAIGWRNAYEVLTRNRGSRPD
jgi:membrane dipeptidase